MSPYQESSQFVASHIDQPDEQKTKFQGSTEQGLLAYVLQNSIKNNPDDVINKIDEFCSKVWMMNLGPEKADIMKKKGVFAQGGKLLEVGGYCGYSALVFANALTKANDKSKVYTIEINPHYAQIAHKIQEHAGLANKIQIHVGTVSNSLDWIKSKGPFNIVFLDHVKDLYLSDFKLLQGNGSIVKGTLVVGDNIIYPGSPIYLAQFKQSNEYESTLYHTFLEYCNQKDAILISVKK